MRKLLCALLAALLLASVAGAQDVRVVVNGRTLSPNGYGGEDGVTYVPLKAFLRELGGWETVWNESSQTAWAETGLFRLTAPVGKAYVKAGESTYDLRGSTFLKDGRTYVPLRSLCDLLGADIDYVSWDEPVEVESRGTRRYTEEDLYWLSRIISAESQGESLLGQIAVGNVVLNRVDSQEYPNTVREVVFDRKDGVQFEPVSKGSIYWEPTEQSVLAARLVLSGANAVGECKYFYAPALSQGTWIRENCTYYKTIGCHRFYQ